MEQRAAFRRHALLMRHMTWRYHGYLGSRPGSRPASRSRASGPQLSQPGKGPPSDNEMCAINTKLREGRKERARGERPEGQEQEPHLHRRGVCGAARAKSSLQGHHQRREIASAASQARLLLCLVACAAVPRVAYLC